MDTPLVPPETAADSQSIPVAPLKNQVSMAPGTVVACPMVMPPRPVIAVASAAEILLLLFRSIPKKDPLPTTNEPLEVVAPDVMLRTSPACRVAACAAVAEAARPATAATLVIVDFIM